VANLEFISGFVWGVVVDDKDPLGMGRVKISIPGMFEPSHPEWALPLGWPGSGLPSQGSKYSTKIGAQVAVIFENGDPDAAPGYLTAPYGASEGVPDGPGVVIEAYLKGLSQTSVDTSDIVAAVQSGEFEGLALDSAAEEALETVVIWEDDALAFFITTKETDRRLVMVDKTTFSGIVLNATDGAQGKSVTMEIFANTSIKIGSRGVIDIRAASVQIQGRKVLKKPGVTTI